MVLVADPKAATAAVKQGKKPHTILMHDQLVNYGLVVNSKVLIRMWLLDMKYRSLKWHGRSEHCPVCLGLSSRVSIGSAANQI